MSSSRRSLLAGFAETCAGLGIVTALVGCAPDDDSIGQTQEAAITCASSTTLKGVDVAHYDGTIDWSAVAGDGNAFAFAKATEGTTFVDSKFAQNWSAMKAAGLARGAYHFFHANDDPIAEADFFLGVMGDLGPGDLPPTLDLEVTDGQSPATIEAHAIAWLDHVAEVTGRRPIVYTSRRVMMEDVGNAMGLDQHAILWDAQWNVSCPDLPDTFTTWAFWQTTDLGTVPGIAVPSSVDLDTFNGDLDALLALGGVAPSAGGAGGSGPVATAGASASTTEGAGGAGESSSGPALSTGGAGSTNDPSGTGCAVDGRSGETKGAAVGCALLVLAALRRRRGRRRG